MSVGQSSPPSCYLRVRIGTAAYDHKPTESRLNVSEAEPCSFTWPRCIISVVGKPVSPVLNLSNGMIQGRRRITILDEEPRLWPLKFDRVPHQAPRCFMRD